MKPAIIIMLTHNDVTVKNAEEIFRSCVDLPFPFWGFKDVGLPVEEMIKLNRMMKAAGKTTFLEVVTYTEEECISGAKLAMDCGFDYLTGTVFYPSIVELLKGTGVKYFPFAGRIGGSPVKLCGTIDEIVEDSRRIIEAGASGVDLVAYRFLDGDPYELADAVAKEVQSDRLIIAGSIDRTERLDLMKQLDPYGFTMGSALFDKKFVGDGSFRENLEWTLRYIGGGE